MKKITDFIVNKRYLILILFLIFTVSSLLISSKVNVNYDISKYLPSSSETRIGMDIMDSEFDTNLSTLNVMVKDIKNVDDSIKYLENIKNISKVETKTKGDYTLFILTLNVKDDSKEASVVYDSVSEYFSSKLVDTSGDVSDYNKSVLPFYIIVLAVASALVILVIMCESYIEPFLFLIAILIAVALNSGTNIIFSSVSNITNSISAILQMALSMDYSIMLMNRYRQERATKDKIPAMKDALYHSFKAISSSSITTVVGLIALVFMSFTIGRDLGFVLAKGVFLSLVSIFTVLPCLILMCDKLIFKFKKKSPIIKLNKVGKISYKLRYPALILFIVIFITSYFLKGNLQIVYTSSGTDEIEDVFTLNNQMGIIYENKDEETISSYCKKLEENGNVDEVLCYGNTINMPLTYDKLNDKLNDLGYDTNVEDYLLKIVYYHYNNKLENNKINLNELLKFIKSDIYKNDKMNKDIDNNMKSDIDLLSNFTYTNKVNKKRTIKELSDILSIKEDVVKDLMVYYNSKNTDKKMTIKEFVAFMNSYVLSSKYKSSVTNEMKNDLNKISKFIDSDTINKKMDSKEISNLFGIDESLVKSLFTYYLSKGNIEDALTLGEFALIANNTLDTGYEVSDEVKDDLELLLKLSDKDTINEEMTISKIAEFFEIQEYEPYLSLITQKPITPIKFVETILNSPLYLSFITSNSPELEPKLKKAYFIMNSTNNDTKYTYEEISTNLGIDIDMVKNVYSVYLSSSLKLTPLEFIDFILSNKDDEILKGNLDSNTLNELTLLKTIMESVLNSSTYTYKELSKVLNIDSNSLSLVYSLYDLQNKSLDISYKDFIDFLVNDVSKNPQYKNNFDEESLNRLQTVNTIINDSINNKKYTKDEVYNILSKLSNNLDNDLIDLVYIYYGSKNEYNKDWTLTIEEFSRYLNEEILNDKRFENYIDDSMKEDILNSKDSIKDAKELLIGDKYSRVVINTNLLPESKETFEFIKNIKDDLSSETSKFYVVGDSLVAYEMSNTFNSELNFITILTMIFIFVVVVVTFKSILIPIILVLLIECAVFLTMGILSFMGSVYFISILIVQSILMGATIDYAILYTSYYIEAREKNDIKTSIINAYNNSIHTILTSALVLIIVTFIVGKFSSAVASKICMTLSEGTLCSALLILILLPAVIAACDKFLIKKHKK